MLDKSHQDESTANQSLARLIKRVMHGRQARAELTHILAGKGNAGRKPDIVITAWEQRRSVKGMLSV